MSSRLHLILPVPLGIAFILAASPATSIYLPKKDQLSPILGTPMPTLPHLRDLHTLWCGILGLPVPESLFFAVVGLSNVIGGLVMNEFVMPQYRWHCQSKLFFVHCLTQRWAQECSECGFHLPLCLRLLHPSTEGRRHVRINGAVVRLLRVTRPSQREAAQTV